jgi:ketosteroid isomerase-like protein
MSRENVELARRLVGAMSRRDLSEALELCDPDVELDMSQRLLDPAILRGHAGLKRLFGEFNEVFDEIRIEEEEVIDFGADVVLVSTGWFRGRSSGADVQAHAAPTFTVRGGKVTRFCLYQSKEEALQAVQAAQAGASAKPS